MDAPLMLTALGVPIDVTFTGSHTAEARAALESRWSLCARDTPEPSARSIEVGYCLDEGPADLTSPLVTGHDLAQLLVDVTHRITFQAIDACAGRLLMFHAAGVSSQRTGATVVFVAPGGTGKTTVCRTLGAGRGYVSDETVGVDEDGLIRPYPKPLSVRRVGQDVKDEVDPLEAGLAPAAVSPYVAAVLLLDRSGEVQPVVEELDTFEAITSLSPETSSLSRLERPLHRFADLLESVSLVARIHYRESASLEPLITQLIGAPGPGHP